MNKKWLLNRLKEIRESEDKGLLPPDEAREFRRTVYLKHIEMTLGNVTEIFDSVKVVEQVSKIQDNGTMTQNNSDNAKSWQTKVENCTVYIGENHILQGKAPDS